MGWLLTKQTVPSKVFLLFNDLLCFTLECFLHPSLMELWTYTNPCLQTKRLIYLLVVLSSVKQLWTYWDLWGIVDSVHRISAPLTSTLPNHYWTVHHKAFWRISMNHWGAVSSDVDTHTAWLVLFTALSLPYPLKFLTISLAIWTWLWQGVLYRPANEYLSACCYC